MGTDGEGVAKLAGIPVFIPRAVWGERVRAKIVAVKRSHAFARLEQILIPSKSRIAPPCPVFGLCGGCALQHLDYEAQLSFKRSHIVNTVEKTARIRLSLDAVVPSGSPYGCRNKLSLPVRAGKSGEILIGFFRPRSHDVVDIADCMMQAGGCRAPVSALKSFMQANGLSAYSDAARRGDIRHLCIRTLFGQTAVTVVGTIKNPEAIRPFAKQITEIFGNDCVSLWYNYHPRDNNVIFGDDFTQLYGGRQLYQTDGLTFPLHPAAFFQVNDSVREQLFAFAEGEACASAERQRTATGGQTLAVEAYAGQGILAARLASHFDRTVAIEIFPESVAAGEEMKKLSGINNLIFQRGDCKDALPALIKAEKRPPTVVVLDPPRAGLSEAVCESVLGSGAQTLIYISCNPATLGRDLEILSRRYAVIKAAAFDMFPQTPQVETAVVLEKLK